MNRFATPEHALEWLRAGDLAPEPGHDPRGTVGDEALNRRARALAAAFSGESGALALQTMLDVSVFRAPVDHRLPEHEYLRHAQLRQGQNQLAAVVLAYLDHAQALERKDHGDRSGHGSDDDDGSGSSGLRLRTEQPDPGHGRSDHSDGWGGWPGGDGGDVYTAVR